MTIPRTLCPVALLVLVAFLATSGIAAADQRDPRLDTLFGRLQTTDNHTEAAAITQRIWQIWTSHEDGDVDELMQRGIAAMGIEAFDEALETFDHVVEIAPGFAEGWNKRATVHYLMDHYDESLADVERTLELEPRHFGALSGKGLIYLATDRKRKALEAFRQAIAVNPHMDLVEQRIQRLEDELGETEI